MHKLPKIITHKNLEPILQAIEREPSLQPGGSGVMPNWLQQGVTLEFPLGELARDGLTTLALIGRGGHMTEGLCGREGFAAQGLEGKVTIRKDLFMALMNLRDILPVHRGRIVTR